MTGSYRCEVLVCWTDGRRTIEVMHVPTSDVVTSATDAMNDAALLYDRKDDVMFAKGWASRWVEELDDG
jgi:hypothetical protein